MKLPRRISVIIIVLAIGIICGASWCLVSGSPPLEQKIAEKVTEKVIDTAIDKVASKVEEGLQKKVIDRIFE
jgi:hypothetical protein